MENAVKPDPDHSNHARALAFVKARMTGAGLPDYPGDAPQSLEEAYAIQDAAMAAWPDEVAGWKVGRITGEWAERLGVDRLAGPVFRKNMHAYQGEVVAMPVFADGFAAVEGEVTVLLGADAPAHKTAYSRDEAQALIESVHLGVEIASSPFRGINDFGPLVTISDFGNNNGLILGPPLEAWRDWDLERWPFETWINDERVGVATPAGIPGGPLESVRFLLENAARRNFPLKKGALILTGAVTGVHVAHVGDVAEVRVGDAAVRCRLEDAAERAAS